MQAPEFGGHWQGLQYIAALKTLQINADTLWWGKKHIDENDDLPKT